MNGPTSESDWRDARVLDLSGLKCPLPSLMTAKALRAMKEGQKLAVIATDPLAPLDLRHLCARDGHAIVAESQNEDGARRLLIRCGPRI